MLPLPLGDPQQLAAGGAAEILVIPIPSLGVHAPEVSGEGVCDG